VEPRISRPRIPQGYGVPRSLKGTLPWSWARERLEATIVYWVASTRPDGRPHAMPTWGAWVNDAFWMEGSPETRRMRNLALNPEAVVHLERGPDVVIVEGRAEQVMEQEPALIERLLRGFDKYKPDYEADAKHWTGGGLWVVRPRLAFGWSSFPADTTRWSFEEG
jgi:hypothetical protein